MSKKDFLLLLDELLETEPGTLTGVEMLETLSWDSLAVVGLIALVDEQFDIALSPAKIGKCETVNDLIALLGDKVTN